MGGSCSAEEDDVDSPLSADDRKLIRTTWSPLYRDWEGTHGPAFFVRLFMRHADVRSRFASLTDLSEEELPGSPVLRAHVLVFGATVNTWVEKLHEADTLVALVQKNTDSHVVRGVKDVPLFKAALVELLSYASETFSFNQPQVDAWTRVADLIVSVMEQRIDDLK
ncbi:globin-1-like [Mya arenaria]|uniref:globin-1-like n=1 Tax=Mya arenaria TaxID=6604 RepID=UPI0022E54908|nr:globin-1-like [Mya arenaria]